MKRVVITALPWLLAACGQPAEPPTPAREPAPPESPPVEAPREPPTQVPPPTEPACEVGEPVRFVDDVDPRSSVGATRGERGGVVVVAGRDGSLISRRIDSDGAPEGDVQRATGGEGRLLSVETVGETTLVLTLGSCEEAAHCVRGLLLDGDGAATDERVSAALPGPLSTFRRAVTEDRVYLAWSADGGHRGLDYWTIDSRTGDARGRRTALGRARQPLGEGAADAEMPVEILGFAARQHRWAALYRRGPSESVESHVFLATDEANVEVEALHEALVVEAIELIGPEVVRVVVGYELARPGLFDLRSGQGTPTSSETLAPGAPVGEPFDDHVRVDLEPATPLRLVRRTAAGDRIGEPVVVAEGALGASAVVRTDDLAWQVFYVHVDDRAVVARSIRCEPTD